MRKEKSLFSFDSEIEDETANSGINAYGGRSDEDHEYDDTGFMKIKTNEFPINQTYEGIPELTVFFNEGKLSKKGKPLNFDSLRLRVWDMENKELMDVYCNIPRVKDGVIKAPIRKGDKFFRSGFDLIYSFFRAVGVKVGKGVNKFTNVDLLQIIDYVNDETDLIEIKATKGHPKSNDGSIEIVNLE